MRTLGGNSSKFWKSSLSLSDSSSMVISCRLNVSLRSSFFNGFDVDDFLNAKNGDETSSSSLLQWNMNNTIIIDYVFDLINYLLLFHLSIDLYSTSVMFSLCPGIGNRLIGIKNELFDFVCENVFIIIMRINGMREVEGQLTTLNASFSLFWLKFFLARSTLSSNFLCRVRHELNWFEYWCSVDFLLSLLIDGPLSSLFEPAKITSILLVTADPSSLFISWKESINYLIVIKMNITNKMVCVQLPDFHLSKLWWVHWNYAYFFRLRVSCFMFNEAAFIDFPQRNKQTLSGVHCTLHW